MFPELTYRHAAEHLWDSGATCRITNSKPENISVLLAVFLERGRRSVCIYSRYDAGVFESPVFLAGLRDALGRPGLAIQAAIAGAPATSPLEQLAAQTHAASFALWRGRTHPSIASFAVVDGRACRYKDKSGSSVACLNDPKTSALLAEAFDRFKVEGSQTAKLPTPPAPPSPLALEGIRVDF
jgi:hypothetical protein